MCLSIYVILTGFVDEISFIDYEYGAYNYCAFDIGNHFNEYGGINSIFNIVWSSFHGSLFLDSLAKRVTMNSK